MLGIMQEMTMLGIMQEILEDVDVVEVDLCQYMDIWHADALQEDLEQHQTPPQPTVQVKKNFFAFEQS